MKRILTWLTACIFAFALGACSLFGGDYAEVMEKNWGITLPTEAGYSQTYKKQGEQGFQGDGFRYHAFSCKENQPMLNAFAWSKTQRKTNFHDDYTSACESWLGEIGVPQSDRPDYAKCVFFYKSQQDMSEIILLFDESKGILYVVESFL